MNKKIADNKNSFQKEDYTTNHYPHCGEVFGQGILVNIKVIYSHCNKFFCYGLMPVLRYKYYMIFADPLYM